MTIKTFKTQQERVDYVLKASAARNAEIEAQQLANPKRPLKPRLKSSKKC